MALLAGQTAIVTGAAQGIGRAIALEFAAEGANVAVLDLNGEAAKTVREEIELLSGVEARDFEVDITDYAAYKAAVTNILAWTGKIDALVNNAGIALYGTILNDSLDDWRKVIAVDIEALYMGSKLVAPHMVERNCGRIINIASIAGFASRGNVGSYNAAKGAVIAYTKSMAVELGRYNILVNAIAPGFVRTPMMAVGGNDETVTPAFTEWYIERGKVPLRRPGTSEDVAGTAVFLASDYCRYMTGALLVVDGGLMSTF